MHHRRSIRLQGYDYAQNGAYFVTLCAHERRCVFGNLVEGEMVLNAWGRAVQSCWDEIPAHDATVELDAFVIMPNHVHAIIVLAGKTRVGAQSIASVGAQYIAPLLRPRVMPHSLGAIVRTFKAAVTRCIHRLPDAPDHPVWQRNYYEHIIRNEESLSRIRAYIAQNPARWTEDSLFGQA